MTTVTNNVLFTSILVNKINFKVLATFLTVGGEISPSLLIFSGVNDDHEYRRISYVCSAKVEE